ncbi:major facilitator superfamily transporter [Meredithblackwellia eburnea MCA 4105]
MAGGGQVQPMMIKGAQITKRQEYFAFGLVTSLFFLWGFSYGLLDVLNKHFQTFFHITKLQSTGLQVAYFGAYLVYSPVAGQFISKFGYKNGIFMGLFLYAAGALGFWPSAKFEKFGGFVGCSFIIASGLATLEVCANSYVTVLGPPENAAFRLNFAQSFNGLAAFVGPLIASKYFFTGANQTSLTSVQYVYLAVAGLGAAVAVLFFFATLPEISEADMAAQQEACGVVDERPLWKRWHCTLGFVSQFMYVGAQVTVASFVLNYLTDKNEYTAARASQLFSFMQLTFMLARFASTPLLRIFNPALLLTIYGLMTFIFTMVAAFTGGHAGLASLYIVFFFESIIYPTTFTLATADLGHYTKRGAGLLCIGVGGGAAFPPAQGAMADKTGTEKSYIIPAIGFLTVAIYGAGMYVYTSRKARTALDNLEAPTLHKTVSDKSLKVVAEKEENPVY